VLATIIPLSFQINMKLKVLVVKEKSFLGMGEINYGSLEIGFME
jgi:hypothetical protein